MRNHRIIQIIEWGLWGLMILLLPISSLPAIVKRLGSTVGPASLIPLALLALIWWLPYLLRRGTFPRQSIPLFGFLAAVLLSIAISFFREIPPFQSSQPGRQALEGVVTLLLGMVFFLMASSWPITEKKMNFTLRLLNYAGLVMLAWAVIQQLTWMKTGHYPAWVGEVQAFFTTSRLYKGRVTAFAYEPSWLAHQLNMLYLPLWLASTFRGFTAHRRKLLGISFENLLLTGGVVVLYLSKSRLGLLAFLLCIGLLLFLLSIRIVARLQARFTSRSAKRWTAVIFYFSLLVLAVLLVAGTGLYLSKTDPRMAELFDFSTLRDKTFLDYAEKLAFAARIVYWQAGWNVFNEHPLVGVGLGNAGFFFYDHLDPSAWEFSEVRTVMYDFASPPNAKNLWVRLLAETGLAGFALFASWLAVMLATGLTLLKRAGKQAGTVGLAVVLTLVGLTLEGFSIDTFALPYFWVTLGLGAAVYAQQQTTDTNDAAVEACH